MIHTYMSYSTCHMYPLKVRSVLQRLAGHGWMGPEFAAMHKAMSYSGEIYVHKFIKQGPILLKNAIQLIERDELYLRQMYKKLRVQNFGRKVSSHGLKMNSIVA